MPLQADEVYVPFRVSKGVSFSDDQARCLGCDAVLYWDEDVTGHWVNHTVLQCLQEIKSMTPVELR